MDGIITGTQRKAGTDLEVRQRIRAVFVNQYQETIHLDNDLLTRVFEDSGKYDRFEIDGTDEKWSARVMDIIEKREKRK